MNGRLQTHKVIVFILILRYVGSAFAEVQEQSARVVADVNGVAVVHDGPISVELGLGQKECVAGENFVLAVRFKNTTQESVVLRGFSIESAIPYAWISIDDGAFTRVRRVHTGDVYVPSRGHTETVLKPADNMEFRVFLARGQLVAPFKRDALAETAVDLSIVICPVLRIVKGEDETPIAVESNAVDVVLGAPTRRQRDALRDLIGFLRKPRDRRSAKEQYRDFLKQYPDVPYASIIRAHLVGEAGMHLDDLKQEEFAEDHVLQDSIEFCFAKGAPFADPLLTSQYCEFFWKAEQWSLLDRTATALADVSDYDRRFHQAQAYIGMALAKLDRQVFTEKDEEWQARLQAVLLQCSKRALNRGDEFALQIAPRLLPALEAQGEWRVLKQAAAVVLDSDPNDKAALRAMELAQVKIRKRASADDEH